MSRVCTHSRETLETSVEVELDIDTPGNVVVETPIPFLNHMLTTMFKYMKSSARVKAVDKTPYDDHHVVEDVAIVIGEALNKCLGDKSGIKRFAHVVVPMDDALVLVVVDVSGRGRGYVDLGIGKTVIGGLNTENVDHFIDTLASRSKITIHVVRLRGTNTHHIVEAVFKGLGMALHEATRIIEKGVVSTKGVIDG